MSTQVELALLLGVNSPLIITIDNQVGPQKNHPQPTKAALQALN